MRWLLLGAVGLLLFNKPVFSQQNLFNIPSGDITPAKKVFFQQQVNVSNVYQYAAKSHFVYGLGGGWEVGANLVNMYFDFSQPQKFITSTPYNTVKPYPYYPLGLLTTQKEWKLSNQLSTTIGTQVGTNLSDNIRSKRLTHYTYALAVYKQLHYKIVGGPYITNWRFVGGGNNAGIMLGTEIHLSNKWLLMGDFISGRHKNAVSVIGFTYNVNKQFQICMGTQIPNIRSTEKPALVLEINLFNF